MKIESFFSLSSTVSSFHHRCDFHKKATSEKIRSYILKNVTFFIGSFGLTALVLKKFPVSSPLLLIGQSLLLIRLYEKFISRLGLRLQQDMRMQKALSKAQQHLIQTQTPPNADPAPQIKAFLKAHVEEKAALLLQNIELVSNDTQYDLLEDFLNKTFLPYIAMEFQSFLHREKGVNLILLDRGEKVLGRSYIAPLSVKFCENDRQIPLKNRLSSSVESSNVFYGIELVIDSGTTELVEIPFSVLDNKNPLNLELFQLSPVL